MAGGLVLAVALLLAIVVLMLRQAAVSRDWLAVVQRSLETSQRAEAEQLRSVITSSERALAGRADAARIEGQGVLHELSLRLLRTRRPSASRGRWPKASSGRCRAASSG